jgi:hypothetical protein
VSQDEWENQTGNEEACSEILDRSHKKEDIPCGPLKFFLGGVCGIVAELKSVLVSDPFFHVWEPDRKGEDNKRVPETEENPKNSNILQK